MTTCKKIDGAAKQRADRKLAASKRTGQICDPLHDDLTIAREGSSSNSQQGKEARREARRARARVMLSRLNPFEKWVATMPPLTFPFGPWETPREAYDGLVTAIEQQIADPHPISIEIKRDGTVVYDW